MNNLIAQSRPQDARRNLCTTRKGLASVLAMLFLLLFSVLAIGFAQSTVLSSQLSRNDRIAQDASTTADAGMQFVRYQLGAMNLPYGTNSSNLMANVASQLGTALNGTANMGGNTVAVTNGVIYLPSQNGWITADATLGTKFNAAITQSGNNLVVTVHGATSNGSVARGVQLQYQAAPAPYSLLGLTSMAMSGSSFTDSYNSSQGAYVKANANSNGSIASNGNITLSGAAIVNGNVRCGTTSSTTILNTAKVTGRNTPLTSAMSYPSVTMPAAGTYTDLGDVSLSSGTSSLAGGVYVIHNLSLSGTAQFSWTGPVTLYITSSYSITQGAQINTYGNIPANRTLNFLPTCTSATWSGSNVCVGTLYAPDTNFTITGGVELFGRIIAKTVANSSTGGMHNDEAMTPLGGTGAYAPVQGSYLEVP
jgi:Tfp pilus assembly protein PilX